MSPLRTPKTSWRTTWIAHCSAHCISLVASNASTFNQSMAVSLVTHLGWSSPPWVIFFPTLGEVPCSLPYTMAFFTWVTTQYTPTISPQVDWFTRDLEHLMNQQLAKMQQLTAHHYVQERLLNEVVTGATDRGFRWCWGHPYGWSIKYKGTIQNDDMSIFTLNIYNINVYIYY